MKVHIVKWRDLEFDISGVDRVFKKRKKAIEYIKQKNLLFSDSNPVVYCIYTYEVVE